MNLSAKIFTGVGVLLVGSICCYFLLVVESSKNQPGNTVERQGPKRDGANDGTGLTEIFSEITGERWKGWRARRDIEDGSVIVRGPEVNHEWEELVISPTVNRSLSDQIILGFTHHDDVEKTDKPTRVLIFSKIENRNISVTAMIFNGLSLGGKIRGYENGYENGDKIYPILSFKEFEINPDSKSAVIVPPNDFMAPTIILHMPENSSSDILHVEVLSF